MNVNDNQAGFVAQTIYRVLQNVNDSTALDIALALALAKGAEVGCPFETLVDRLKELRTEYHNHPAWAKHANS